MPARTSPRHTDRRTSHAPGARSIRFFAAAAIGAVLLSVAPATALAQGATVDPPTYVHSVCTALSNYSGQVTTLQSAANLNSATSLTDVRDRIVTFLSQVRTATGTAVTALQNAGSPNIKDGSKIAAVIVRQISNLGDAFAKAEKLAQRLSTTDLNAFKRGAAVITKLENSAGKRSANVLADLKGKYPSIKAAKINDPACQGLK